MKATNQIKLGIFVLSGITFLILGLYYIGSKRNIFRTTINVSAIFNNVDGLLPGNNVRFNGINVGTVSNVTAVADTSIKVDFTIEKDLTKYISKKAIVSIGTDGLLGNKLVNITCKEYGISVEEGDILYSINSVPMEIAVRTLTVTNENLKVISENLKNVTEKLNNSHSLWNLLADSLIAENVKSSIVNLKIVSNQSALITGNLKRITDGIKNGEGSLGALITDTSFSHKLNQTIVSIKIVSDSVALISGDLKSVSEKIKNGEGLFGTILNDTMFVHDLNKSIENIKTGSKNFNENMEALKYSWPFKKYFKRQEKNKKK